MEGSCEKEAKIPYVAHLLAVTAIALEHGATEEEAIAALLHDAVEDAGGAPGAEILSVDSEKLWRVSSQAALTQMSTETSLVAAQESLHRSCAACRGSGETRFRFR